MFKAKDAAIVDNVALFAVSVSSVVSPFAVVVVIVAILPSARLVKGTIQHCLRVIPVSSPNTETVTLLCLHQPEFLSDKAS